MTAIPFTAPVAPTPHGLLASPYWWTWLAYLIVLPMAYALMPGQLRESVKALWEPVGRWIASVGALLAVLKALVAYTCFVGLVAVFCWLARPHGAIFKPRRGHRTADTGLKELLVT